MVAGPDSQTGKALEFELPRGRGLLFSSFLNGGIDLFAGGQWKQLLDNDDIVSATYSKTGHLLFQRLDAGLWAAPFSEETGEITGGLFQVDPLGGRPTLSDDGRLLYARGRDRSELVRVSREGQVLETLGAAQFLLQDPALSPDERWVAVFSREQGQFAIWLHDSQNRTVRRLTFSAEPRYTSPAWAGNEQVFYSGQDGSIYRQRAAGGGGEIRVASGAIPHVSPDGRILIFSGPTQTSSNGRPQSPLLSMDWRQETEPRTFLEGAFDYSRARFSPEGNWIAYVSNEAGEEQVFVRRFPSAEGPWQVSTDGGGLPRWSPEGDELFFVRGRELMSVKVRMTAEQFESDRPQRVLTLLAPSFKEYEVGSDGETFILVRPSAEIHQIAIVDNWLAPFQDSSR